MTLQNPLSILEGTWMGNTGVNLIAVPTSPGTNSPNNVFKLLVSPYVETLIVDPIGGDVLNRGKEANQINQGVTYTTHINDAKSGQALHVENGMWLSSDQEKPEHAITRMSIVPHGDSIMAIGSMNHQQGAPDLSKQLTALPTPANDVNKPLTDKEYIAQYLDDAINGAAFGFDLNDYLATLRRDIKGQEIVETTTFDVSSQQATGKVVNTPFIVKEADATVFESTFWIETVQGKNALGQSFTYQQLQYIQLSHIVFDNVMCPHINVNTLVKQ